MKLEEPLVFYAFLAFVSVLFPAVLLILRFSAGVSWKLPGATGPVLRKSWIGSGSINEVHCGRSIQIVEYPAGWLVRMLPTFIFGVLWLPKKETTVGPIEPGGWFYPSRRRLEHGTDSVVLCGHLADFMTDEGPSMIEKATPTAKDH